MSNFFISCFNLSFWCPFILFSVIMIDLILNNGQCNEKYIIVSKKFVISLEAFDRKCCRLNTWHPHGILMVFSWHSHGIIMAISWKSPVSSELRAIFFFLTMRNMKKIRFSRNFLENGIGMPWECHENAMRIRHVQKTPFFMDPHARLTKGGLLVPRTLVCL